MPTKEQVLRLLEQGYGYRDAAEMLGIPPGQAYLIATGLAADGGDTATRTRRQRPGVLASGSQRLVSGPPAEPEPTEPVRDWMHARADADAAAQDTESGAETPPEPADEGRRAG